MPGQPALGRAVRVEVIVAREEIEKIPSPTSQQARAAVDEEKRIIVEVRPRANCRTIGEDRALIAVPHFQKPVRLVFEVEGIAPGGAEVWVEARQGAISLAFLQLQPVFVPAQTRVLSAGATAVVDRDVIEPNHAVLRIYEESLGQEQFRLRFNLDCKNPNINVDRKTEVFQLSRAEYVASQYAKLEAAWSTEAGDYDRFMRRLRSRGSELYDSLVPEDVRKALWSHKTQIKAVQVISEEPFIPWEIAYMKDPAAQENEGEDFLGNLGLVRWLHNIPWPRAELRLRPDRVRFVIPPYPDQRWQLPGAKNEEEMLLRLFPGARAAPVESGAVQDFLEQGENAFDVLHFACHGHAEGEKIWDAGLMMTGRVTKQGYQPDPLEVGQVRTAAKFGTKSARPIVFLNACQIGRTGRTLSGVGGFASAFLNPRSRQGAGLFIGTLWSVGDGSALTFAETFYNRIRTGDTLVSATRAARECAKAAREPTWLAYTVYGHPHAKVIS